MKLFFNLEFKIRSSAVYLCFMGSLGSTAFVITLLFGGCLFMGLLIVFLLILNQQLGQARFFLAATLLFLLLHLGTYLLFTTEMIRVWPHLLGISYPTLFLLGPAFYFFVRQSIFRGKAIRSKDYIHLIPFLAILTIQTPFFLSSTNTKEKWIDYLYDVVPEMGFDLTLFFQANAYVLLLIAYCIATLVLVKKSRTEQAGYQSHILQRFSRVMLVLSLALLIAQSGFLIAGAALITTELVLAGLLTMAVLLLGAAILGVRTQPFVEDVPLKKYRSYSMDTTQSEIVREKIITTLESDRLHLQNGLKLAQLADHIQVPSHHVSQVLNTFMETNFHDLISEYRVKAAQEMLTNGSLEQLSIQAIGEECGFSSKASFYRAFRKWAGGTPTEYLEKVKA